MQRRAFCAAGTFFLGSGCLRLQGDDDPEETVSQSTTVDDRRSGGTEETSEEELDDDAGDATEEKTTDDEIVELSPVWEQDWRSVVGGPEAFFVSDSPERVQRLDDNGDPVWATEEVDDGSEMFVSPFHKRKWVTMAADVVAVEATNDDDAGILYAFDGTSGDRRWVHETNSGLRALTGNDQRLYYGKKDAAQEAAIQAVNVETGDTVWETRIEGRYFTGLAVEGSRLYVGFRQSLHVLDASTGERLDDKDFTIGASNFNVADGSLYVGQSNLRSYDLSTGELKWEMEVERGFYAVSAHSGGAICGGTKTGWVTARDVEDGSQLWEFRADDIVRAPMVASDDLLVFQDQDKMLYVVDTDSGELVRQIEDYIGFPSVAATDEQVYIEGTAFEPTYSTN